ncbi:hypothetical protein CMI47_08610 [Candidatus Pacearchaeota archaeon]|jgi:RNA polymerase primary sigma factor|nr:hypothetical protein [Candidatus Pacearchaeota archaeon]|tara:strand:- start:2065 stop:2904 length:840 start_codon:yes stop_codon:yes gene_type:complete
MINKLLVKDVLSIVDGCNHDGQVLPVSIIKTCFSDLQEMAIEMYEGRSGRKSLSPDDEKRFFMAYNASRIHLFNHVTSLKPNDSADHLAVIYEKIIEARNNLSLCNSRLVHYCLNKFFKGYPDSMQKVEYHFGDAFDGLLNAIKKFDYARGFKFSTYATRAITHTLIKVADTKKDASLDELSANGFDVSSCKTTDECFSGGDLRIDVISDLIECDFIDSELSLSDMDRAILKFHIDTKNNLTNAMIGQMYGISRETVRLKKIECLKKIESLIERKLAKK